MPVQEYVVCHVDGLWQIRLDGRLVSGQATQIDALHVAHARARADALRGKRSKILVGDGDGQPIEFPVIGPR